MTDAELKLKEFLAAIEQSNETWTKILGEDVMAGISSRTDAFIDQMGWRVPVEKRVAPVSLDDNGLCDLQIRYKGDETIQELLRLVARQNDRLEELADGFENAERRIAFLEKQEEE